MPLRWSRWKSHTRTFRKEISSRKASNSAFNLLITAAGSRSSFTVALFLMSDTRCANLTHVNTCSNYRTIFTHGGANTYRQVDNDSSVFVASALIVAIMMVLQLPPKLSRRTEVIMLSRYGICDRSPLPRSERATITRSRKKRDVLMNLASFRTDPDAFVLATLSDPAKSTKFSLLRLTCKNDSMTG
jgi:hypothetical protein